MKQVYEPRRFHTFHRKPWKMHALMKGEGLKRKYDPNTHLKSNIGWKEARMLLKIHESLVRHVPKLIDLTLGKTSVLLLDSKDIQKGPGRYTAVFENKGTDLNQIPSFSLKENLKTRLHETLVEVFSDLKSVGIYHNDLKSREPAKRNILYDGKDFTLIDFGIVLDEEIDGKYPDAEDYDPVNESVRVVNLLS